VVYWLKNLLWEEPYQKWFVIVLFLINAVGSISGYFWYEGQLRQTPLYLWPLIADSPFSALLFTFALLFLLLNFNCSFFQLWAYASVMKYGLWAIVVISDFWLAGGEIRGIEVLLWLSHAGMFAEGFLYLRHLRFNFMDVLLVICWLVFNDYFDYALGFHPYLFMAGQETLALKTALLLDLFLIGLFIYYRPRQEKMIF